MEGGLSPKDKIYQQDVFSCCIQGRLKLLDVKVIKYLITCTNQLASCIVFGCLSPSYCTVSSYQILKKESYDLRSLAVRSGFDTVLICVSLTNCNLI